MAEAAARGDAVFVILLTLGDGFKEDAARYYLSLDVSPEEYLHMGYERRMETLDALAHVGVPAEHVSFMGFPDGGLDALWLTHWDGEAWSSPTTGFDHVPYLDAWRPDAPYRGRQLLDLLMARYEEIQPTQLIMPSAFDTHPDHWATNAYATLAWAELAHRDPHWRAVPRWGYLVHWPAWPLPLAYRPEMETEIPERLLSLEQEPWHAEPLSFAAVEAKRDALMAHQSQVELIKPFMLAFPRRTEMFAVEQLWQARRTAEGMAVDNPRADWLSRTIRRANPLQRVTWRRRLSYDGATVELSRPLGSQEWLEVSLHPVDNRHRHTRFVVGPQGSSDAAVAARHQGTRWDLDWPASWIGDAPQVMAGVQVRSSEQNIGKVPFRLLPWEEWS